MKLTIIYDEKCPKLTAFDYSQTYRDQFLALIDRFDTIQKITDNCSAKDIEADVIIFYDIHSSHHITIDGIERHSALKYTYFNDPWQIEIKGRYLSGNLIHKLSAKQRSERAKQRGIDYIICPYKNLFDKYIAPHCDIELLWFPIAPDKRRCSKDARLQDRKREVLLNGTKYINENGFNPYVFRAWAYKQNYLTRKEHGVLCQTTPMGMGYSDFLSIYAGSLALCDTHICPKYSEIPLAGCVCFAQYLYDYEKMGFKDGESCIYVTRDNLEKSIKDFKSNVSDYQQVADAGRKIMEENWTSKHFADFIYNHAKEHLNVAS